MSDPNVKSAIPTEPGRPEETTGRQESPEVGELLARLRAAIEQAISFLDSVDWTDYTSEHDGANVQFALEEALALLDHAGRSEEP